MFTRKDIILIAALSALAAGLLLLLPKLSAKPAAESTLYLRYSLDGQVAATLPLTQETDLTVDQGDGIVNVLHLTPHGFFMAFSTCRNQVCVHQGEVTRENMNERPLLHMIVCAPNRLVAELLTEDQVKEEAHAQSTQR